MFGVLRSCYYAPAQFQKNGPVGTIRWYFAPEGAAIYTAPNIFFPLSQTLQYQPTDGVGERFGGGYPYFNGVPSDLWAGDVAHGTLADFLGETEYTGPTPDGEVPLCAFDPALYMLCPACEESMALRRFTVVISTPDYPEIDGLAVVVEGSEDEGLCEWHGSTIVGDTFLAVDIFSTLDLDVHTLHVELDWPASPYGEWHMDDIIGEPELSCLPWGFDYFGDVIINSADTGNRARVRTDPSYAGGFNATFEIGAGFVTPVTRPGGIEIGGVATLVPPAPSFVEGIEIGGEASGVEMVPGFEATIEIGTEVTEVDPNNPIAVGFKFGVDVP